MMCYNNVCVRGLRLPVSCTDFQLKSLSVYCHLNDKQYVLGVFIHTIALIRLRLQYVLGVFIHTIALIRLRLQYVLSVFIHTLARLIRLRLKLCSIGIYIRRALHLTALNDRCHRITYFFLCVYFKATCYI